MTRDLKRFAVVQIAGHPLEGDALESAQGGIGSQQRLDVISPRVQLVHEV